MNEENNRIRKAWSWLKSHVGHDEQSGHLSDFTTTLRVAPISLLAVGTGVAGAFLALVLLRLIGFFTNLFFYHRLASSLVSPGGSTLGLWVIPVPIVGGLIVGIMSRYGSERIRGHGIPEAIEAILFKGSRVEPRLAILKPVSSAIAIGSGGPFGAEGPIIMTGGAVGSLLAQFFQLTDAERKTLLVAGAAAGMSATFASPVAAVLLAVELLLFEWKPRSLVPVACASATAAALRRYLIGMGPLFPKIPHSGIFSPGTLFCCVLMGLLTGVLAVLLTNSVYAVEDAFQRLPIHWMWWPALGGIAVGIGGYIYPEALGVGYDIIARQLQGDIAWHLVLGILLVKSTIWCLSLGSGTSGGVLAPLLMMGGALGAAGAHILPYEGPGFWPLVTMASVLGGTMRTPLTAVIFAIELTHDMNMLLPLLIGATMAHAFTALVLRRSILTEKISRRGLHLSREYAVDPLEIMFIREVMRTNIIALPGDASLGALQLSLKTEHGKSGQRLYPVVNSDGTLKGVLTRGELQQLLSEAERSNAGSDALPLSQRLEGKPIPIVAYPDEPLRAVAHRMADSGYTRFPVVDRRGDRDKGKKRERGAAQGVPKLVGMVILQDLLKARVANLAAERKRERVLPIRIFPLHFGSKKVLPSTEETND
jgi:CIC family chloride channel protein